MYLPIQSIEVEAPTVSLTTATLKEYLRVTYAQDDAVVSAMLTAAWMAAESYCNTLWGVRTVMAWFNAYGKYKSGAKMELPNAPIASLTSLKSRTLDGTLSAALTAGDDYFIEQPEPNMVVQIPRTLATSGDGSEITGYQAIYEAGHSALPALAEEAIKKICADLYQLRGNDLMGETIAPVSYGAKMLLAPLRNKVTFV